MDFRNMGFSTFFVVIVMLTMSIQPEVMGFKEVKVGGVQAWHIPDGNDTGFYKQWAVNRRFHVGDTLRFEYKNDTVLVVDKYGYYHCDSSKATSTFNDGNTTIKLEHPGPAYFISGAIDHCRSGQRLEVDVMSPHSSPTASPPQAHGGAVSPAPGVQPKHSGSHIVQVAQVSSLLGLVVAASLLFV
ncbi:early nodulin-like protein 21 [Silene latifolia]|uniref:early nodulin-like protein 21 n=1 Tax=Silene latifolia TaxID=37657 RepID=UPI003D77F0EC